MQNGRYSRFLVFLLSLFLISCDGGGGKVGTGPTVTGSRGSSVGRDRCIKAGVAATGQLSDQSDMYVYILLIKWHFNDAATPAISNSGKGKVDQHGGTIEDFDQSMGIPFHTYFELNTQQLKINDTEIDLTKGSIVSIELKSDGAVSVLSQCSASGKFDENPLDYMKNVASKCKDVEVFLKGSNAQP